MEGGPNGKRARPAPEAAAAAAAAALLCAAAAVCYTGLVKEEKNEPAEFFETPVAWNGRPRQHRRLSSSSRKFCCAQKDLKVQSVFGLFYSVWSLISHNYNGYVQTQFFLFCFPHVNQFSGGEVWYERNRLMKIGPLLLDGVIWMLMVCREMLSGRRKSRRYDLTVIAHFGMEKERYGGGSGGGNDELWLYITHEQNVLQRADDKSETFVMSITRRRLFFLFNSYRETNVSRFRDEEKTREIYDSAFFIFNKLNWASFINWGEHPESINQNCTRKTCFSI